jgi:hypothetical protein
MENAITITRLFTTDLSASQPEQNEHNSLRDHFFSTTLSTVCIYCPISVSAMHCMVGEGGSLVGLFG